MDGAYDGLLIKSEQNKKCVQWAENKDYYDIALSRYYYSIFQKVIYILQKEGLYGYDERYTHGDTVDKLVLHVCQKNCFNGNREFFKYISDIKNLKFKRNDADYGYKSVTKSLYQVLKAKCELAETSLNLIIKGDLI